nr:glycosyltransferase [Lysobacter sp. CAU 1642]
MRVLAVGRLSYYKGFEHLLQGLSRVHGASLVIAGRGEQEPALRALADRLGIAPRVSFLTDLDDAQVEACYRDCDVVCLPSTDRAEAFGLVLLEAMRAAKPVLASRLAGSGMLEVVIDGETGLQVAPGDPGQIADALARLRDDPILRARLGTAGRARFDAHFAMDEVCRATTRIYREALAAG